MRPFAIKWWGFFAQRALLSFEHGLSGLLIAP